MENNLYRMSVDFGRMGDIEGLFIATSEDMETLYGKTIYLGGVLGKHSEIEFEAEPEYFEKIPVSLSAIDEFLALTGTTISGYNPFLYINQDEDEEEDE